MLRPLLAALLMSLVALPQGLCFCDWLHCASSAKAVSNDDEPTPDDHDTDCPCKLREAMAVVNADDNSSSGSHSVSLVAGMHVPSIIGAADVVSFSATHAENVDEPIPLILCALRI